VTIYSTVVGTGGYLPERILTNAELAEQIDTSHDWIVARTGIHERRIAAPDQTTCDLAEISSRRAIEAAGLEPGEIDLIILATCTPDRVFPSTACLLQERLGMGGGPAFDVTAACAGFVYALATADNFIRAGSAKRALVVGAETMSRVIDWDDRGTCILFADGAGAVVLEASEEPGIYSTHLHADGQYKELLSVPGWVSADYAAQPAPNPYMTMQGNEVFKVAVGSLGDVVLETLEANGLDRTEVDWLIPHQANIRIIQAIARRLGLSMDQVVTTIDKQGNTSAASVPLAFDTAVRDGRIKRGDLCLLEAFGGGFAWGSALLRY